jgi:hypothetical protein
MHSVLLRVIFSSENKVSCEKISHAGYVVILLICISVLVTVNLNLTMYDTSDCRQDTVCQ